MLKLQSRSLGNVEFPITAITPWFTRVRISRTYKGHINWSKGSIKSFTKDITISCLKPYSCVQIIYHVLEYLINIVNKHYIKAFMYLQTDD